jgi:hypothetical protein
MNGTTKVISQTCHEQSPIKKPPKKNPISFILVSCKTINWTMIDNNSVAHKPRNQKDALLITYYYTIISPWVSLGIWKVKILPLNLFGKCAFLSCTQLLFIPFFWGISFVKFSVCIFKFHGVLSSSCHTNKACFRLGVGVKKNKNLRPIMGNLSTSWLIVWPQVINKILFPWGQWVSLFFCIILFFYHCFFS